MTNEQKFLLYIIGQVLNNQPVLWETEYESLSWEEVFHQAEYYQVSNYLDDVFAMVKGNPRLFNVAVHTIR